MSEARIPQAARQLQRTLNQIDHLQEAYNRDWRMHGIFGNVVIRERLQRELAELRRLKNQARKERAFLERRLDEHFARTIDGPENPVVE